MREDFVESLGDRHSRSRRRTPPKDRKVAQGQVGFQEPLKQESLSRRWGYTDRSGEDYAIFRRFLLSKVGQVWDDVYAEICAVNDKRNYNQHKLIEAIDWNVTRDTQIIDGKVCDSKGITVKTYSSRNEFFVHPKTGLLCKAPGQTTRRHKWKSRNFPHIVLDELHQYHRVEGIWYLVTFVPMIVDKKEKDILAPYDLDARRSKNAYGQEVEVDPPTSYSPEGAVRRYGARIRAISRKQAGKRELRYIKEYLENQGIKE